MSSSVFEAEFHETFNNLHTVEPTTCLIQADDTVGTPSTASLETSSRWPQKSALTLSR